jgi:hypothetical protein
VLETLISACRADFKRVLAGHSMSASPSRKYMKTQLSKDFGDSKLKSLKNFFVKKLSTVSSIIAACTDQSETKSS